MDQEIKSLNEQVKDVNLNNTALKSKITALEMTNSQLSDQNILLKAQLTASSSTSNGQISNDSLLQNELGRLEKENQSLQERFNNEVKKSAIELEKLKKDQEDLLELLSDQENKILKYKNQMKAAGLEVEDDDESDETEESVSGGISIL